MCNVERDEVQFAGNRPGVDGWLRCAIGVIAASFACLILSDVLPPALEVAISTAILCLFGVYGAVMLAALVRGAVVMLIFLRHASPLYRRLAALFAVCGVLLFAGTLAVRQNAASLVSAAVLQWMTASIVVFGLRPRSPWCAAAFGSATALIVLVVYLFLYALFFGIEGGYLIGDIGPGLSGLTNLVALLCVCSLAVFPLVIGLVAGAIGGFTGWILSGEATSPSNR